MILMVHNSYWFRLAIVSKARFGSPAMQFRKSCHKIRSANPQGFRSTLQNLTRPNAGLQGERAEAIVQMEVAKLITVTLRYVSGVLAPEANVQSLRWHRCGRGASKFRRGGAPWRGTPSLFQEVLCTVHGSRLLKQPLFSPEGQVVASVLILSQPTLRLVHEIYVDEAQDFSPAELTALMSLCAHADGVTIAGDTCQTINPGSAFSFQDIMDTFLRLEPKCFAGLNDGHPDKEAAKCSRQMSLAFNYRSAPSIVRLANTVSELLVQMFPNTVDAVEETATATESGEVPLFVHSQTGSGVVDIVPCQSLRCEKCSCLRISKI